MDIPYTPIPIPELPVIGWLAWKMKITPVIPKFYWDAYSQEEIIKELCKELDSLAKYSAYLGDNMNIDRNTIDLVATTLNELQAGGWFDTYSELIQEWIRDIDNLDQIVQDVLDENELPSKVAALEDAIDGEGGIDDRLDAAESDIDGLQADIHDVGGIDARLTAAEGDIDALQADIHDVGGIDARLTAAEGDIDALENTVSNGFEATNERIELEAIRASIPEHLHEATPIVRIPVDFVSADVQTHPQGFTTFGGTPADPTYAAVYQYHRVDTVNGANTMGTMEVWRLADHTKVSTYELAFGHGNGVSTDWTNKQLIVAGHSYGTGSSIYNPRMYILDWTEAGTITLHDTIVTPFTMIQSAGILPNGEYWVWAPYESGIYVSTAPSPNMVDWQLKIPWSQRAMGTGLNQSAFYTEELDSFGFVYSGPACIAFADANTGYVWRTMQIDPALGFIDTEELESAVVVGTRLWLVNSPVFDTNHNGVLNPGAEATIWTVDLPKARNYKDWSSSRAVVRFTYHVDSTQDGLPTSTWTNPGQAGGRVDLNNPRDLIGLEHYPGEKLVYIDTPYPTRVFPFINCGFVILSGVGNADLVNGNQCETIGGLYMYGQGTYVTWFGWNTGTGIQITPEAVANWPQVYNNRPTWIRMTYFPTLNMRGATATKTAQDDSVWIGGEDGILEWPSVTTKTTYMYMLRALLHDSVTAQ